MIMSHWDGLLQSSEDLARKFNNTYVWGTIEGYIKQPTALHLEGRDGYWRVTYWNTEEKKNRRLVDIRPQYIDIVHALPPLTGAIPFFNTIMFSRRVPQRQWQVGTCRGNSMLYNRQLQVIAFDLQHCLWLFDPVYEPIKIADAVERFKKEKNLEALALDNRYWLSRGEGKNITLYRNMVVMGGYVYGGFFANPACGDFKQELYDDLKIG
jgi:hypothetical protein